MPGHKNGHHLITKLRVSHAPAGAFLTGGKEHTEQIVMAVRLLPACLDDVPNDLVSDVSDRNWI